MTDGPSLGQPPAASVAEAAAAPSFQRSMGGLGALFITLSCLSPSIGVFIVGSDVIRQAGTGVFLCFTAAAVLGVAMAAVYGELASAFPETGGEYTILSRALGAPWGYAVLGLNLLGFSIAQALSGFGVATYLAAVWPGLPVAPTAAGLVVMVTATAVLNIRVGASVTGAFLAVELLALAVLAGLGLAHPHRGAATLLNPLALTPGGGLGAPGLAVLGAATAGAIYAFNGYGAVVFLGEELHEAPRRIARVVFLALAAAVVTELLPLAGVLVGVPDLRGLEAAGAPIPAAIAQLAGPLVARLMSLGVALAIFNAMIAVALMAGRQLFSTGRDGLWRGPAHPRADPWERQCGHLRRPVPRGPGGAPLGRHLARGVPRAALPPAAPVRAGLPRRRGGLRPGRSCRPPRAGGHGGRGGRLGRLLGRHRAQEGPCGKRLGGFSYSNRSSRLQDGRPTAWGLRRSRTLRRPWKPW